MAVYKADILDVELNTGNIARSFLCHNIGKDDQKADRFGVRCFRDGEPVSLSGVSIQGFMLRPNGSHFHIHGSANTGVSGNEAWVDLPQEAYDYEGQFCLALKLIGGEVTGTIRIIDGMVNNTFVDGAVAPTAAVPTYQEILSVYDQMVAAKAGSVRFDTDQTLTAAQKTQARGNIEAASESDVSDLKSAFENTKYYYADGSALDTVIPFIANVGDTIRVETKDGTNFTVGQVSFYTDNNVELNGFALSNRNVSSREFELVTSTTEQVCAYAKLRNGVAQDVRITNLSLLRNEYISGIVEAVDNLTESTSASLAQINGEVDTIQDNIRDLDSALDNTKYYYTDASEFDTEYPFIANTGDTIRVETKSHQNFIVGELRFYTADGVEINAYALSSKNVKYREFSLTGSTSGTYTCSYIKISAGTAEDIRVTNLSLLQNEHIASIYGEINKEHKYFDDSLDHGLTALYHAVYSENISISSSQNRLITPVLTVGVGSKITSTNFDIICLPVDEDGKITYSTSWGKTATTTTKQVVLMIRKPGNGNISDDDVNNVYDDIVFESIAGWEGIDDKYVIPPATFHSSIASDGSSLPSSTTRIATNMVYLDSGSAVVVNENYKFRLYKYNDNDLTTFVLNGDWVVGRFAVTKPGWYIILCAEMFDATISSISASNIMKIYSTANVPIKNIQNELTNRITWQRRTLNVNGKSYGNTSSHNRIVSPMIVLKSGTTIISDGGYQFNVWFYSDSSMYHYIEGNNTGWVTSHTIFNECYCIILVRKNDSSSLDSIDIDDILKHIHISNISSNVRGIQNHSADLTSFINYTEIYKSGTLEIIDDVENMTAANLYNLYDGLVSSDTNRFSRELLGYATSSNGDDDTTLPIYGYTFKARTKSLYSDDYWINTEAPTLLVVCGIHGGTEKSPAISMYYAIKNAIVQNTDEKLSDFLSAFDIKIIPCANPWGYNNASRFNARSVNIARNFSLYWSSTEPGTDDYGGTEPLSEKETQAVMGFVNNNQNAYALIDYHNCGDYNEWAYMQDYSSETFYIYPMLSRRITALWCNKYSVSGSGKLMMHENGGHVASVSSQAELLNISHYCLLEINYYGSSQTSGSHIDSNKYKHDSVEMGIEAFVNLIKGYVAYDAAVKTDMK